MLTILNLMLSPGKGGIEQAGLDTAQGLVERGHTVLSVVPPGSPAQNAFREAGLSTATLRQYGGWDVFASWKLRGLLRSLGAEAVLAHGNRALIHAVRAAARHIPVVAFAHNYKGQHWKKASRLIAITPDIAEAAYTRFGVAQEHIHIIPNGIRLPNPPAARPARRTPPVIGTLGRFVGKKGFEVFLHALAALHARGIAFDAILAGEGEEEAALKQLAAQFGIAERVRFPGWVADKRVFYESIDVFCLPSHHEPFGLVALEAMAYRAPILSTASEGPSAILEAGKTALITPLNDADAMADGLARLLAEPTLVKRLSDEAFAQVSARYALPVIAEKIEALLLQCAPARPTSGA